MTARVFVDTNPLVYARDSQAGDKQRSARAWLHHLSETASARTSIQILNEYYFTVTSKLNPPMDPATAREDVRDLRRWGPVPLDAELLETAWKVQDRSRLSFWDSLVVAAARAAGCAYLLTEDLQDGQDVGGVRVISPFTHEPGSLP